MTNDALKNKVKIDEIQEQISNANFNIMDMQDLLKDILEINSYVGLKTSTIEDLITQFNLKISENIQNKAAWEEELIKYLVKPIEC